MGIEARSTYWCPSCQLIAVVADVGNWGQTATLASAVGSGLEQFAQCNAGLPPTYGRTSPQCLAPDFNANVSNYNPGVANSPLGTGAPGIREVVVSRKGDADRRDLVAVEEPMEVRVNGASFAVIMRTPGADRDLAAGFLLAEDVIRSADEIGVIEYCQDTTDEGRDNTINVTVTGGAVDRLATRLGEQRQVMMTASCGLCGRRTIESLQSRVAAVGGEWTVPARRHRLPARSPAGIAGGLRIHRRPSRGGIVRSFWRTATVGGGCGPPQRRRQDRRPDPARRHSIRSTNQSW